MECPVESGSDLSYGGVVFQAHKEALANAIRRIESPPRALHWGIHVSPSELGLSFSVPRTEELAFAWSSGSRGDTHRWGSDVRRIWQILSLANHCSQAQKGPQRESSHQQQSQLGQFGGQGQLPLAQQGHLHSPSWQGGQAHFPFAQHGQVVSLVISFGPHFGPVAQGLADKRRALAEQAARLFGFGLGRSGDRSRATPGSGA